MKTIKTLLAALFLSCLSLSATARGDEAKPAIAKSADGSSLNAESLKEMLTVLGYDFEIVKGASGGNIHYVKFVRNGMKYDVNVNIAPNGSKLWASVALADLTPEQGAQSDKLLKLLEVNQKIGPAHFYYYVPHKMIYLARPMDNRAVTAKLLREHLEAVMDAVVANETTWNSEKWTPNTTASK